MLVREIVKGQVLEVRHDSGRALEVDERGRAVDRAEVQRRGRIVVGLKLRAERQRDDSAGRRHRKLSLEENRCLHEVVESEIRGGRAS